MAIYYVWSAAAGSANGSSWANAFTTLTTALATEAAGDTLYVAHDHAESTASAVALASSGTVLLVTKIICVDRAGTVPPVSADRRATAQVTTTGNSNISFTGYTHYDGIIFNAGNSTGVSSILVPTAAGQRIRFDNCSFRIVGTSSTSVIAVGNAGSAGATHVDWNNVTVSFGHTSQSISISGLLRWRNTPSAVIGATIPTTLLLPVNVRGGAVECIGVDFSAVGSGKTIAGGSVNAISAKQTFTDCKLNAAGTMAADPNSTGAGETDFIRSSSAGVNYTLYCARANGSLTQETTIVRTGGASDGTTPISWKIVTPVSPVANYSVPFECPPIAIWNDTTGSAVTATVEGIGAALPTDAEVWLEVEYLGDASSPQGSFVSDGKADLIASAANQTSSSETWGGSTAAFKLAVTFTAQQKGWIYARVKIGKASSTFYIDPLVTLT